MSIKQYELQKIGRDVDIFTLTLMFELDFINEL